jgi:hypothetical protein
MDDRIHKVGWIEFKGPELRQTSRGCLIRSGRREMVSTLDEPVGWCVVHGIWYMLMAGQTSVGGPCIHIERGRREKRDSGTDRFPHPDVVIRETTFGGS